MAFHVNFNQEFFALEAGTIARDIIKPRNGRWAYEDRSTKLKEGDIVYYWIHVVFEGLGYNLLDQQYTVTGKIFQGKQRMLINRVLTSFYS